MNLPTFDKRLLANYKSASQIARVLSEPWVSENIRCPACGGALARFANNTPLADLYCSKCAEQFELKSKSGAIGRKVSDEEYSTKIRRLQCNTNPNLMVLSYSLTDYSVTTLIAIPKYFFVPAIIERRAPLSSTARRAGWVGSNIILDKIPMSGKVSIITRGEAHTPSEVRKSWSSTSFLSSQTSIEKRGWILDTLRCIERIPAREFSLEKVYSFEEELQSLHPRNTHIKPKLRQQLQVLRDLGQLEFLGGGKYRKK